MKNIVTMWPQAVSRRVAQWRAALPQVPLRGWLRWTSRRWLRILGRPGVLAVGILVVFPPFYFSAIVPAQERLDSARRSTLSLREQIMQASKTLDGGRRTPTQQLAEYYRIFPEELDSPQWLEKLVTLAEKNGLSLNEGEYKVTRDRVGRLMRFQMVLPVKGEYPQIRSFLSALPAELPIVALENVQFTRQKVADPAVEAQIRLVLYLEQAS